MHRIVVIAGVAGLLWPCGACREDEAEPAGRPRTALVESQQDSPKAVGPEQTRADPVTTTPASLPASSPAVIDPPASSSTAPGLPETAVSFRPLLNAAVGEQAEYVDLEGRRLTYEVAEAGVTQVVTRLTLRDRSGRLLGEPATRHDRRDDDPLPRQATRVRPSRGVRHDVIEAAGRKWDAALIEDRWVDEEIHYVRRSWVSPSVPVFGLIRMELTGDGRVEARLELRAFSGAGSQPADRTVD